MFETILVAVDINDTDGAKRNIEAAVTAGGGTDRKLHLLCVVPDSGMAIVGAMLGPEHSKNMLTHAKGELESLAASALPSGVTAALHVAQGSIYDQIIKAADRLNVDLIVVGAHRPEFQDYLVGPNAARVVRHAKQSVFVVR